MHDTTHPAATQAPVATTPEAAEMPHTPEAAPDAQPGDAARTYTQEQVERIIKDRLEREKARSAEAAAKAAELAKMEENERLQAEKRELEERLGQLEQEATSAKRQAALTGKVVDPAAALRLLEDRHLDADGNVLTDALLADYPFLKPSTPSAATSAANPTGAGATRYTDSVLRSMSPEEINANWDKIVASRKSR